MYCTIGPVAVVGGGGPAAISGRAGILMNDHGD